MRPSILAVPPEVISTIFDACLSLHDLLALANSCKQFRDIFQSAECRYYDIVLRRTLLAYEDALRLQRASVAAMLHLRHLGYDDDNRFQPMLPPDATPLGQLPAICRFDQVRGEPVNVPTEDDIIKLGETPIGSRWEAQRLIELYKIVSICRSLANASPMGRNWFHLYEQEWTQNQEERFFRGAYRYWLYCCLFYPGCYLEPFFLERGKVRISDVGDEIIYDDLDMSRFPLFIPDINSEARQKHVESIFEGFMAWLVHDGERRGEREHAADNAEPEIRYGGLYAESPPAVRGGMRELMLLHTLHCFLEDVVLDDRHGDYSDDMASMARFPWFGLGDLLGEVGIWQARMKGEEREGSSELQLSGLTWGPKIPSPLDELRTFPFTDEDVGFAGAWPVGWPQLEAVVVGLRKHYNAVFSHYIEGEDRQEYQGDGGAVLDLFVGMIPLKTIGE